MKALQVQAPRAAALVDVPDLARPRPGEVLLRVELVGMCGTDLNTFRGRNPLVDYPRILGHEIAATVAESAPGLRAGAAVTVSPYSHCGRCASCRQRRYNACAHNQTLGVQRDGAMTEYISVPQERLFPAELSLEQLCLVEPLTVGAHAAKRGRVQPGDTVAVFGCGGVGLGAIASCAFRGARTIAIDIDDAKLAIAQKAGAAHTVNIANGGLREGLAELTQDQGPDVIIEAIGSVETFQAAVAEVAFGGRVVYIGYAKEPVTYETKLFVQKELDILGSRNALPEDFHDVIRMLEAGNFPVSDTVSAIVAPEEAASALASWSEAPGRYSKIMVRFGPSR